MYNSWISLTCKYDPWSPMFITPNNLLMVLKVKGNRDILYEQHLLMNLCFSLIVYYKHVQKQWKLINLWFSNKYLLNIRSEAQ